MARRGFPIVLSAPSGTGKTTLAHLLNESMDQLALSVSYTTRAMRGAEQEGVDYHFIEKKEFQAMIERDEFLEWAEVHGNLYGSGSLWTKQNLKQGLDLIFDIDVQGGLQIKARTPEAVTIFIVPPSFEELEKRLIRRGTESPESIKKRLDNARAEVEIGLAQYDYVINNEKLDRALFDITSIIRTHHIMRIDRKKIEARLFEESQKL